MRCLWFLVVGLVLCVPAATRAQGLADLARARVQRAVDAVRHDSGVVVEAAWTREMRAGGEAARLARLGMATVSRRSYRHAESDARYAALLPPDDASADAVHLQAMVGHAASLLTRWRPLEALPLLDRALAIARRLGDGLTEGEVLTVMATTVSRSGSIDSSRALLRRAAAVLPPRSRQDAARLCTEASLLRAVALKVADSLVTEGLTLARALGDTLTTARCLVARGGVLEGQGRIQLSNDPLEEAIELLRASHDYEGLGSARQWLGYTVITYAQEFGVGRRWAEAAIESGERSGSPIIVAWARLNLAQATLRVGDAVSGMRAAREAQETFRRIGDRTGEVAAAAIAADAMMLAGRVEDATRQYREIRVLLERNGVRNAVPGNLLRQAAGLVERGHLDEAERAIDSAVTLAAAAGIVGITNTSQHYWRGLVDLRRGAYDRAVERFLQFKLGVGSRAVHLNLDADLRIAEAYALSGRFAAAESVFTRGSASLDQMRSEAVARDDILRLLAGLRYDTDTDLGIATIVAAFAAAGRVDGGFGIAESERARWLWIQRTRRGAMARIRLAERPLQERLLGLADVQRAVDEETAILAYVTGRGGEHTTLFAIWRGGARAFVLPPVDSLAADLGRITTLLESGAPAAAPARVLGGRLLDSALRALPAGIRRLRLVPDGPLHHLPFDALLMADGRRVLERYAVSSAPSVRLAVAESRSTSGGRVVAYGDAVFDSRFALARLPGSADEAEAVVRAAGGRGETRLRAAARAGSLREGSLPGVGVLHLATHARVQDWGMLGNAIYLGAGPDDDGRLGAEDLASMSLGVGLVVLSGCRTVGGVVATGEGVQGLVAPILEAGAGAVAVTHWNIRDRSLIALMGDFYRGLAEGARVDDALARAKRRSYTRGESPAVWGALTLIGDASVRPLAPRVSARPGPGPSIGPRSRLRAGR